MAGKVKTPVSMYKELNCIPEFFFNKCYQCINLCMCFMHIQVPGNIIYGTCYCYQDNSIIQFLQLFGMNETFCGSINNDETRHNYQRAFHRCRYKLCFAMSIRMVLVLWFCSYMETVQANKASNN